MSSVILSKENITEYDRLLSPDVAENVGRQGYHGIADEEGQTVLVWREYSETKTGQILFFKAADAQKAEALLAEYEGRIKEDGMEASVSELSATGKYALSQPEKEALVSGGYEISQTEGTQLSVTLRQLSELPVAKRCEIPPDVSTIGSLNIRQFGRGIRSCMHKGAAVNDICSLPVTWFDRTCSSCVCIEGNPCGYLLFHRLPSGAIRPELFAIRKPAARQHLMDMIHFSLFQAMDTFDAATPLLLPRQREMVRALTDKLIPGIHGEDVFFAQKKLL